jgi:hypothetical protein
VDVPETRHAGSGELDLAERDLGAGEPVFVILQGWWRLHALARG